MFIKYEPLPEIHGGSLGLLSGRRVVPNSLLRISFRTCRKEKGVPFRLPIPRVRDIITGSVKLPGNRPGLSGKVILVSHKPYED
jgi:hypothetical protein